MEQAIQQAQRQGHFDNLPGAGKPLRGLDRPHDPEWWVKGLIERENLDLSDALPGALALRRERERFPDSLLGLPDEAAVRAHLEDFNERVLADRRRPWFGPGSPAVAGRVDVEETLDRWRELREPGRRDAENGSAEQRPDNGSAEPAADPAGDSQPSPTRRRWWSRSRA